MNFGGRESAGTLPDEYVKSARPGRVSWRMGAIRCGINLLHVGDFFQQFPEALLAT